MKNVILKDLGLIAYQAAWDFQTALFKTVVDQKVANRTISTDQQVLPKNYLLCCQHPHVYTLGRNGKEEHLLLNETELNNKGATFIKINRGGDITYHGHGQLVVYPILDLDQFFTDIGRYIRLLEEVVIQTLAEYTIEGKRSEGESGVWLDVGKPTARKICAVGVHLSRWVTMHGIAFNINTDLSYFQNIIPCGISDKGVTSLAQELGHNVDIEEVQSKLLPHFTKLFEAELTL